MGCVGPCLAAHSRCIVARYAVGHCPACVGTRAHVPMVGAIAALIRYHRDVTTRPVPSLPEDSF